MPPGSPAWQVMYCGIAPCAAETPVARVRHRRRREDPPDPSGVGYATPVCHAMSDHGRRGVHRVAPGRAPGRRGARCRGPGRSLDRSPRELRGGAAAHRSEEHTSELQSRENLVCRLLLEKKKKNRKYNSYLLLRQVLNLII